MEEIDDLVAALVLERPEDLGQAQHLVLPPVADDVHPDAVVVDDGDGAAVRAEAVVRGVLGQVEGG
ncbi:hypothetical protein [Actinokineospora bangkokensis]|uniref:hypothetical protein n=1 Tax=Actinokineospora bangkokensis TaxID=1193682 RepID=UPI001E4EA346|nr:hypothetical protein [Actinokineospora bangkokensis]